VPEVSVIIPAYNSAHFLPAALDSVLAQTYRNLEILVIDDGSTDDTEAVMRGYGPPVRYLRQVNGGVASARNRGIQESRGRYVAFLDADDTWHSHKLQRQLEELARRPECRLCYSAFTLVRSDLTPLGTRRSVRHASALEDLLLRGNIVGSICTVVCERSLLKASHQFDPALSQCADWDMWVQLATLTDFLYVDEPLVTYRQHTMNMSRNAPLLEHDSLRVLEKGFANPALPPTLVKRRRRALGRNYTVLAGTYFHAKQYRDCLRCAAFALALDCRQALYLVAFPLRTAKRKWTALFWDPK
jgi:glycosyltransferase involved in cell wall biosynthesis